MRPRFYVLPAVAAALALSACGRDDAPVPAPTAPAAPAPAASTPAVPDTSGAASLSVDGTVSAFESGITNVPVGVALYTVDGWIARLATVPAAAEIVEDLRELRGELTATPLDGEEIGETLKELGQGTTAIAATANAERASLERLGTLLTQAGTRLDPN